MNRSYLSGAQKRKLKEKKERETKRMKSMLLNYAQSTQKITQVDYSSSKTEENEKTSEVEETATPTEIITGENGNSSSTSDSLNNEIPAPVDLYVNAENEFIGDPALWVNISEGMREYFIQEPPLQNMHLVGETERLIGNKKRSLTEAHFYRLKVNGEKVKRDWLILSPSDFSLYCWICKLFSPTVTVSCLSTSGFNDWKHTTERLHEHENSYGHRAAVCVMIQRKNISCRIDSTLVQQDYCESKYWFEVLCRVVAVTKFLSIRGLAFFGQDETIGSLSNGNFLGCLELLSEFDPFLAKHLELYGNPGSGRTSYLSSTTVNEFIHLMAKNVFNIIISEIKPAKFFSIILDSTPDISHTDQLTFVVRYVSSDCEPIERFLTFIPIQDHSSEHLEETVVKYLESIELNIADCRGQSFDNASNMAGKYSGLQARIKQLNPFADFIPCAAHSLNLVVVKAVECNGRVLDFFTFLQELYNFFSKSNQRWNLLCSKIDEKGSSSTLKSRAETRWCANAAATKALKDNYKEISDVLLAIF